MDDYALAGHSLFETLRSDHGRFWRLEAHHDRLTRGADCFDLEPPSLEVFTDALRSACSVDQDQVLRFTLMACGGRWSETPSRTAHGVSVRPRPPSKETWSLMPATVSLPNRDWQRSYKTGSRITYQVEQARARGEGLEDALFADEKDRILETATGNLFFLHRGSWVTPPLELGLLPGVCRAWLIELGLAREAVLYLRDLTEVAAVAVTNAVIGVVPVTAIGSYRFPREAAVALRDAAGPRRYVAPVCDR